MVFVKVTQEGSGGGYDSLEENFNLKEDVVFLALKYAVHPASKSFPRGGSDPDARVSNRWTWHDSIGKNASFKREEWVAWDMFL